MRKRKKPVRRIEGNIYLPSWLKLRMNDSLKTQVDWMIERATRVNAVSMTISAIPKYRPWNVKVTVERLYNSHGHQKR